MEMFRPEASSIFMILALHGFHLFSQVSGQRSFPDWPKMSQNQRFNQYITFDSVNNFRLIPPSFNGTIGDCTMPEMHPTFSGTKGENSMHKFGPMNPPLNGIISDNPMHIFGPMHPLFNGTIGDKPMHGFVGKSPPFSETKGDNSVHNFALMLQMFDASANTSILDSLDEFRAQSSLTIPPFNPQVELERSTKPPWCMDSISSEIGHGGMAEGTNLSYWLDADFQEMLQALQTHYQNKRISRAVHLNTIYLEINFEWLGRPRCLVQCQISTYVARIALSGGYLV